MERGHEIIKDRKIGDLVDTQEIINYLLRLSDAKLTLLKKLLNISRDQERILSTDEAENLDQVLEKKQGVMDKIDLLDREFLDKYDILKKALGIGNLQELEGQNIPGLDKLQERIREIMEVLGEINIIDENNTKKIKENISKLQGNLKTIQTGKKVISGYGKPLEETPSIFIDKKR